MEIMTSSIRKHWIGVIFIVVLSAGTLVYNVQNNLGFANVAVYNDISNSGNSGVDHGNSKALTEADSTDKKIYSLLDSAFNVATLTNDNTDSSVMNFTYSETGITQCANAIHLHAQRYVDIGKGHCVKRLPQCLMVGNFKCGTRELIDFMSMHPRIVIRSKPIYELEFFDKKYAKGFEWYQQKMPCSFSNQVTIEKTPSYFQSQDAPERIYGMNSSTRIIVLVREPVSRTLSQVTFYKSRFPDHSNRSLKAALYKKDTDEINEKSHFVRFSIYDEAMERYLRYFKLGQIKIIHSEDFKTDPYTVLHDLETFLNLEHTVRRSNFVFNTEKGFQCLRESIKSKEAACYGDKRGRNETIGQSAENDKEEVSEKLKQFFKPHNERFYKLIGRSFDW